MPPAAGIEPKTASRCIRPMAKCPRMACNRATMNAGEAAISGITQRRPIILYETLEALYQQVNAPFCAQRREKFLARAARRCAPRQVRQLEELIARYEGVSDIVTVTASAGEGGAISPSGETQYYYESDAAYSITPNEGYVISDVLVDGQSVGAVSSYTFSKLTTGHTIRAEFEPITFTVTFVDGITGETLDTQTVAYGKDAAAPQAPQHEGYTFSGWDAAFTNVRSDLTVTAQYDKNSEPTTPDQPEPGQPDQPDEGKQDDKPTTGDSFSAGWLALTLFSGAMAACIVLSRRRKAD